MNNIISAAYRVLNEESSGELFSLKSYQFLSAIEVN